MDTVIPAELARWGYIENHYWAKRTKIWTTAHWKRRVERLLAEFFPVRTQNLINIYQNNSMCLKTFFLRLLN